MNRFREIKVKVIAAVLAVTVACLLYGTNGSGETNQGDDDYNVTEVVNLDINDRSSTEIILKYS